MIHPKDGDPCSLFTVYGRHGAAPPAEGLKKRLLADACETGTSTVFRSTADTSPNEPLVLRVGASGRRVWKGPAQPAVQKKGNFGRKHSSRVCQSWPNRSWPTAKGVKHCEFAFSVEQAGEIGEGARAGGPNVASLVLVEDCYWKGRTELGEHSRPRGWGRFGGCR